MINVRIVSLSRLIKTCALIHTITNLLLFLQLMLLLLTFLFFSFIDFVNLFSDPILQGFVILKKCCKLKVKTQLVYIAVYAMFHLVHLGQWLRMSDHIIIQVYFLIFLICFQFILIDSYSNLMFDLMVNYFLEFFLAGLELAIQLFLILFFIAALMKTIFNILYLR